MNELINNLRLDAGISQLKDDPRLVVIDREGNVIDPLIGLEKFAKLIVKECINKVRSRQMFGIQDEHNIHHAFDLLVYDLESHFGVDQ